MFALQALHIMSVNKAFKKTTSASSSSGSAQSNQEKNSETHLKYGYNLHLERQWPLYPDEHVFSCKKNTKASYIHILVGFLPVFNPFKTLYTSIGDNLGRHEKHLYYTFPNVPPCSVPTHLFPFEGSAKLPLFT